jgi:glycosyltransferase involved in cell wall biosynthesis
MAQSPPDALFVPAHVLPPIHPRSSLVTIHDLGYLHFPKAHPWHQRLYLDLSTRWNARNAAHLLADSKATRNDLVTTYGVPAKKVTVAYPGSDESLAPVHDADAIEETKARYGIGGARYLLYLGTLQPRKNLARLVEAFARFTAHHASSGIQLVLAGKRGWLYDDLFEQMRRRGLDERVRFPGYVAEEDKAALLSGALAFVFPSLHEGFGIPVLEAQACGCPVVTSNTSSLPEVAGDGALLVDPGDTADIANAMERIATEPGLRDDLSSRGFANARRFSWETCAETVLQTLDEHLW